MAFLGTPGDAIVRVVHIGAVVIWIGLLHFSMFIRPRLMAGLSEGTMREVGPHLAARLLPWTVWAPLVTLVSGLLLYVDRWVALGPAGMGWGIHVASVLALVLVGLVHGVNVPAVKRVAAVLDGAPPPSPGLLRRLTVVGWVAVALSWVVLVLMVFAGHWAVLTR